MRKLCSGTSVRLIKPLQPGELILVKTVSKTHDESKANVMDINDAVAKRLDGEVLCRIN